MFIFDCECHIFPARDDIQYFPIHKLYTQGLVGYARLAKGSHHGIKVAERPPVAEQTAASFAGVDADALIQQMDEVGVQMACVLPESMTALSYGARMVSTNGWLVKEVAKYPDRLMAVCNVGPIISRGVKNAVWEVEHLIREMNVRAVKLYPVDDTPINNRELWPFYERVQELGVPLFIHTGAAWVIPGCSEYAQPRHLEEVCEDFPELTIVAYHMGYPNTRELNLCAAKYPNLYIGTSLLPFFGHGASRNSQKMLGEAIMWAGIDKIVWGTDLGANEVDVEFLKQFQISEEVQRDYGYPPLSEEDRQKWAGLNLARIMKVSPPS